MDGVCICINFFQIDFESMTVLSVTKAKLLEDRQLRQQRINEEKLKKIESEICGTEYRHYILLFCS